MKNLLLFNLLFFPVAVFNAQINLSSLQGGSLLNEQTNFISDNQASHSPTNTYTVNTLEIYPTPGILIDAFPNPDKHYVWITVKSPKHEMFEYTLKGKTGKLIQSGKFHTSELISMANYCTGIYFITITRNKSMMKSFQVIKI